ncbi:MAG: lyase [Candidatus Nitrosotenuis sp.]
MKKNVKGLIVAGFFAVILLTSTITLAINSTTPSITEETQTVTGTPADHFPDLQRPRFCGTGDAKSNQYVTEFKIPTACTQPLAITADPQGNVWFAQTNTGNIAKFDPLTEQFTEYENPAWPEMGRSMMWGIDYSHDGNLWYTDDALDSIWEFSTIDRTYERIGYSTSGDSLPQHIKVRGGQIILNDFYGGKLSFFDTRQAEQKSYINIPTPIPGSFVSGFDVDSHGNVWYTNWILKQGGTLVKFDYAGFSQSPSVDDNSTALEFSKAFNLPPSLETPIGLSVDQNDNIWIADTSSSSFFKFSPSDEKFTRYVTSDARETAYGNVTGVIKTPISGPYWTEIDGGRLVFNEQIANAIAVFDVENESLVEYEIPSRNPNWADCGMNPECGISQAFGFKSVGDKVWFTEWVENNIGVVDLAEQLPFDIGVSQKEITVSRGQTVPIELQIIPTSNKNILLTIKTTAEFNDLAAEIQNTDPYLDGPQTRTILITASESALSGSYNVLISARTDDVTLSQFVTVNVV